MCHVVARVIAVARMDAATPSLGLAGCPCSRVRSISSCAARSHRHAHAHARSADRGELPPNPNSIRPLLFASLSTALGNLLFSTTDGATGRGVFLISHPRNTSTTTRRSLVNGTGRARTAVRAPTPRSPLFARSRRPAAAQATVCWTGGGGGGVAGLAWSPTQRPPVPTAQDPGLPNSTGLARPSLRLGCVYPAAAFPSPVLLGGPCGRSPCRLFSSADGWATAAAIRRYPSSDPSPATTAHHQVRPPLLLLSCCAKPGTQTLT